MARHEIPVRRLNIHPFRAWDDWFLLTAGEIRKDGFNPMTVSWGTMGVIWEKPVVQVVVRPTRHTFKFTETGDSFTLCAFSPKYKGILGMLGTKSGRDIDKTAESGLTVLRSTKIVAPGFDEAELILECRKIYFDDIAPSNFIKPKIDEFYPQKDYHRTYIGEILAAFGTDEYDLNPSR